MNWENTIFNEHPVFEHSLYVYTFFNPRAARTTVEPVRVGRGLAVRDRGLVPGLRRQQPGHPLPRPVQAQGLSLEVGVEAL